MLITTNLITVENFAASLKQVNVVNKTHFDNKLTSFNKWLTSSETKNLETE